MVWLVRGKVGETDSRRRVHSQRNLPPDFRADKIGKEESEEKENRLKGFGVDFRIFGFWFYVAKDSEEFGGHCSAFLEREEAGGFGFCFFDSKVMRSLGSEFFYKKFADGFQKSVEFWNK